MGIMAICLSFTACGENTDQPVVTDPDAFYRSSLVNPFWLTDTVTEEAVTMVQYNTAQQAYGYLAYLPNEILKVTNYAKTVTYTAGVDYQIEAGKISKTENSAMPNLKYSDLIGNSPLGLGAMAGYEQYAQFSSMAYRDQGKYIYYNEYNSILTANQILVTYKYDKNTVKTKKSYAGSEIPKTMEKLNKGEDLTVLIYGDSISYGCNASGYLSEAPHTKTWFALFKEGLESKYDSTITLKNTSVGGTTSWWGSGQIDFSATVKADLQKNVINQSPDLVVIGFGMNDGSGNVSVSDFISNIQKIMTDTRAGMQKDVEFLIINTMMPSPLSAQDTGRHAQYTEPLRALCNETEGATLVDMSAIHKELSEEKFYADMLSNNINHPNDYMVRLYAMNLLATMIQY